MRQIPIHTNTESEPDSSSQGLTAEQITTIIVAALTLVTAIIGMVETRRRKNREPRSDLESDANLGEN